MNKNCCFSTTWEVSQQILHVCCSRTGTDFFRHLWRHECKANGFPEHAAVCCCEGCWCGRRLVRVFPEGGKWEECRCWPYIEECRVQVHENTTRAGKKLTAPDKVPLRCRLSHELLGLLSYKPVTNLHHKKAILQYQEKGCIFWDCRVVFFFTDVSIMCIYNCLHSAEVIKLT